MSIELLAPAGNLEKLKMAIIYGADAVYLAGEHFGLRAGAGNFSYEDMKEGMEFVHRNQKKAYVALNIIPHNDDLIGIEDYIEQITKLGADAVIVSDPGVFTIVKGINPTMPIHISTQANVTNYLSAQFWQRQGATRIISARELSLKELFQIHKMLPKLEIEAFVHGAMCISYSGRCLLSNFMCGRDANRGDCAHPCRWKYYLTEEKRPGEYFPIVEDDSGTFIFNSKDLCMIEYIPELINAGVTSFKIEGRMKSSFYVSTIVRAYRMALDLYLNSPENYMCQKRWCDEVNKVSNRGFTTGFFVEKPDRESQNYGTSNYIRTWDFVGIVLSYNEQEKTAVIEQRNRILTGDYIEIMQPSGRDVSLTVETMRDMDGNLIDNAPHPQMKLIMNVPEPVEVNSMLRKKIKDL